MHPHIGRSMLMVKPGLRMVRVKQAFGVLILGTALYYGYVAYELFANRWVDASSAATREPGELSSSIAVPSHLYDAKATEQSTPGHLVAGPLVRRL